jgi:hypothetical protein
MKTDSNDSSFCRAVRYLTVTHRPDKTRCSRPGRHDGVSRLNVSATICGSMEVFQPSAHSILRQGPPSESLGMAFHVPNGLSRLLDLLACRWHRC